MLVVFADWSLIKDALRSEYEGKSAVSPDISRILGTELAYMQASNLP